MSQSSTHSRGFDPRASNRQRNALLSRESSQKKPISYSDAYLYALRVAYLSYLLQPRAKRTRHLAAPRPTINRSTGSFHDLMKDFSLVRDSKTTRFPSGFVAELEKRLAGVLTGKERRPEYQDALIKRTFAVFLNALSEQTFKRQMERDRKAEDLVLIFFSNATKELQKGKPPGDENVKSMVDRHVALFVRLLGIILKDHDWARGLPDLMSRLTSLETKLLAHDQDLSNLQGNGQGTTVEEIIPLSYEVKDMPLVQVVMRIFGVTQAMAQSDINMNKVAWTEKAALQDLKTYQTHLNLGTKQTLNSNDFDLERSYEAWKKSEGPELSEMMLAIVRANPDLAKMSGGGALPQFHVHSSGPNSPDVDYSELSKSLSMRSEISSTHFIDPGANIAKLHLNDNNFPDQSEQGNGIYTFIPSDTRAMYRFILSRALSFDLRAEGSEAVSSPTTSHAALLSKQSQDLLNEIAVRWRIPRFSRAVLFLDVVREKFVEKELDLTLLDTAFEAIKNPVQEAKKGSPTAPSVLSDREKWTVADFVLMRQLINQLHDALLRDLYTLMMQCYDNKTPPLLSLILLILETHIQDDPSFSRKPEEYSSFRSQLQEGLLQKAQEIYGGFVDKEIPLEQDIWEFQHVAQLGKTVLKLAEKIQKRYQRNPEVFGVNPLMILLTSMLPAYAEDSGAMIERIIQGAKDRDDEVPILDGFNLYKQIKDFRRVQAEALPDVPFAFNIEEVFADFVWRWIRISEQKITGWVENAIKQDSFTLQGDTNPSDQSLSGRHSTSVLDIFRCFGEVIDPVSDLGWEDDLGSAKFMTAISKVLGNGVARYCEVLHQMFSREMDRLSPDQEAAAHQTTQEKWMQLAKDTWHNREKIEPFQFYAKSFVKLNNIAFAINQWDQLEKDINVDGLAEVIQRNEPPVTQRPRRITNYVFTIKIVEGEDLKACDVSGYSDPYVVLTDEYQKRLSKTRIIYQNLNPRWEESVDITTQGPLNIVATVWDWDTLGDHDYVGRTTLKLDPSHFGDFVPREYWLDLDTQGRLLIRVSMEGERDDIQFYFGKAFRNLKRTERDMTRKITDKLSAYINYSLSRRALRSLLSRGITISSVSSYFSRNRASVVPQSATVTDADILNGLSPLFTYFNENFAIMNQTLTPESMLSVMTRIWKEVLVTIEALLVPPLSDKISHQRPLTRQELDVVFKWLELLFGFFNAADEKTGESEGVPARVLKSPKYHEIQTLNFFYFETTENLIRTSEKMASATVAGQQASRSRLSAPPAFGSGFGGSGGVMGVPSTRRAKSIMLSRNLGTMKKAKEEKWKEAQAEPSDDMILRILRMRPDAAGYLRDRSRQKERLATAAAADLIVRQSLLAGSGGRMTATLGRK